MGPGTEFGRVILQPGNICGRINNHKAAVDHSVSGTTAGPAGQRVAVMDMS